MPFVCHCGVFHALCLSFPEGICVFLPPLQQQIRSRANSLQYCCIAVFPRHPERREGPCICTCRIRSPYLRSKRNTGCVVSTCRMLSWGANRSLTSRKIPQRLHSHCALCLSSHQHAGFPCCGKIDLLQVTGVVPIRSYSTLFPFSGVARNWFTSITPKAVPCATRLRSIIQSTA